MLFDRLFPVPTEIEIRRLDLNRPFQPAGIFIDPTLDSLSRFSKRLEGGGRRRQLSTNVDISGVFWFDERRLDPGRSHMLEFLIERGDDLARPDDIRMLVAITVKESRQMSLLAGQLLVQFLRCGRLAGFPLQRSNLLLHFEYVWVL